MTRGESPIAKVIYEKRGQIAYITLNRLEAHNAVDTETDELLFEAWTDFNSVVFGVCCVKLRRRAENAQVSARLGQLRATIATNCGLAADWPVAHR
jgi:enoyl-CoA hydratase/carnithine racemase